MTSQATSNVSPTVYEKSYDQFASYSGFLVKSVAESAGSTVNSVANNGGEVAVQALFDVLMDGGHRMVLVNALNSPSIKGWVRDKLQVFLYGSRRPTPALLSHLH